MMLADADEIEADAVGKDGFLGDVPNDLGLGQQLPVGTARHVAEGVEAELESPVRHG